MGYEKHSVLVVTAKSEESINLAYEQMREIIKSVDSRFMPCLTLISRGVINEQYSFALLPDGSNEGWTESNKGEYIRNQMMDWLDKQWGWGKDKMFVEFINVDFGGDDRIISIRESDKREWEE